jgi:fucose permease
MFLALFLVIILANLPGLFDRRVAGPTFVLLGAFAGPIFPTLAGAVLQLFKDMPATAFGCAVIMGPLGHRLFGPLLEAMANRKGPRFAIKMAMLLALLFLAVTLAMAVSVTYEKP